MGKRIVIMAGGTGGHVFPALAVAHELKSRDWQISWLGTRRGLESRVVPDNGIEIDWLPVEGIRGKGVSGKFSAVLKLIKACLEAFKILRLRRPDLVLGMGGFVSGPGGLMAQVLRIPLLIHEQNRVPGTTNRWLRFRARKVMEAFPGSFSEKVGAVFTGNPLRKEFQDFPEKTVWNPENERALRILLIGGSQGARILNQVAPAALAKMHNVEIKHQTGREMVSDVAGVYQQLSVNAETVAFFEDIVLAYQWADLVICRSGAMTVSELAAAGLPAVLVPLPHAIDDHQSANARYLSEIGAAILLPQKELNEISLLEAVNNVMNDLPAMSSAARKQARLDATRVVSDLCASEAE